VARVIVRMAHSAALYAIVPAVVCARAEAIRAFLVDQQEVALSWVQIIGPVTLEQSTNGKWVRCRLDIATDTVPGTFLPFSLLRHLFAPF